MKVIHLLFFVLGFGLSSNLLAQNMPSRVNCPMCIGGQVKMPCMNCGGTGRIMQAGFGGFPIQMMCNACGGAGRFCGYCGNQGTIANPVANYPVKPVMDGGVRCIQCYGTGYWICSMCQGLIPKVYSCSFCNNGVGTCSICGGSGTFFGNNNVGGYSGGYSGGSTSSSRSSTSSSSSRSSTSSSSISSRPCRKLSATDIAHCNGTGICSKCNGRGKYTDYSFGNSHLVDPCITCGGNGKCPSCHGTGKRY